MRISSCQGGEDDYLVGGAVRDPQLVTQPAKESCNHSPDGPAGILETFTFLWICEFLPPVSPVPGDLAEATVDPQAQGDRNYPDGVEEENTGGHEYLELGDI